MAKSTTVKQEEKKWDSFSASMTVEGACGYETDDKDTYISACQYGYAWKNSGINSNRISSKAYGKIYFRAEKKSMSFNSSLVSRILYKFFKGVIND